MSVCGLLGSKKLFCSFVFSSVVLSETPSTLTGAKVSRTLLFAACKKCINTLNIVTVYATTFLFLYLSIHYTDILLQCVYLLCHIFSVLHPSPLASLWQYYALYKKNTSSFNSKIKYRGNTYHCLFSSKSSWLIFLGMWLIPWTCSDSFVGNTATYDRHGIKFELWKMLHWGFSLLPQTVGYAAGSLRMVE